MDSHELFFTTRDLAPEQFETMVAQARVMRTAYAESVASERAMFTATGGLSHQYAEAASPEGVRRSLMASYARAGMTPAQIRERLGELGSGAGSRQGSVPSSRSAARPSPLGSISGLLANAPPADWSQEQIRARLERVRRG
jgi:hypothetical protein